MKYLYKNILGTFVFDNQFNLVEEVLGKDVLSKMEKKYQDGKEVPEEKLEVVLEFFRDPKYFDDFYWNNLELTKKGIQSGVSEDVLIIQTISNIQEVDRMGSMLAKRLREWYGWYLPELRIENQEKFVSLVVEKGKKELMKELGVEESMGGEFSSLDVEEMKLLGKEILKLLELKKKHTIYLEKVMKKYCPNLLELAGATIGAKLLELGKGLKHLALLPASTVQLLGAEKALFRHIKTGSLSPKYGVIVNHPIVQNAKKENRGKAARQLADKLSLCARLDYFKGEFKAKEYKKMLEKKFK